MENITKERKLEIEKNVNEILTKRGVKDSPIIDIVRLVKKDKFKVKIRELGEETTGLLLVNDKKWGLCRKKRTIVVNSTFKNPDNESDVIYKKSRFITAHEYGHFILHREPNSPIYAHRDTYHRTEVKEIEADYFARSILMPLERFGRLYSAVSTICENNEDSTIELLSRAFGVTKNKIKLRIGDLAELNS